MRGRLRQPSGRTSKGPLPRRLNTKTRSFPVRFTHVFTVPRCERVPSLGAESIQPVSKGRPQGSRRPRPGTPTTPVLARRQGRRPTGAPSGIGRRPELPRSLLGTACPPSWPTPYQRQSFPVGWCFSSASTGGPTVSAWNRSSSRSNPKTRAGFSARIAFTSGVGSPPNVSFSHRSV